ncbi:MAG: acyl-CoA dehydrogenase family protein [Acidimicrobiia bacterium]
MNFTFTDEELAVNEAAVQAAGDNNPWMALVDGGWTDLLLEDPDHGLGYLGLVAEGLGAAGVSVPLVGSAVVFPTLFAASADGRRVAVSDVEAGDGLAEDGRSAECLVMLGDGVATAHEEFLVQPVGALDGDGLARVEDDGPVEVRCDDATLVAEARRAAAAVAGAEMAGAMRRVAEMTAGYVAERQQFGRPIAAFQVVAHGAARLATLAEGATWMARAACRSADPETTHAAKGWISSSSVEAAAVAHQLHGAIGFTEEYGLQRLTKRLRTLRFAWGDDAAHHLALGRLRATTGG